MKDSEFIELLNLYLDHEISAADAARLEAEVQRHPERRRVYLQYCRMQKACTMLAKDFGEQPATAGTAPGERKVVAFEPSRSTWGPGLYAAGGLVAAAACVAVVFINRPASNAPVSVSAPIVAAVAAPVETKVMVAQTENAATSASIARTVTIPAARRTELQPVLVTRSLSLGSQFDAADQTVAADAGPQLDWIRGLQIAPVQRVQADELRFDARPPEVSKQPAYGNRVRPAQQGVVEMTAFQFQK